MKLFATKIALCSAIFIIDKVEVDMMDDYRLARNYQNHRESDYADYLAPSTLDFHYDPNQPCFSFIWSLKDIDWISGTYKFSVSQALYQTLVQNSEPKV